MIARVWQGVVPLDKADRYGKYLSDSDRGVRDYEQTEGNRGVCLLRRVEGGRAYLLLISLWDSRQAIAAYAGPEIDQARYFELDRECLIDPEPTVKHFEVLAVSQPGGETA